MARREPVWFGSSLKGFETEGTKWHERAGVSGFGAYGFPTTDPRTHLAAASNRVEVAECDRGQQPCMRVGGHSGAGDCVHEA